MVKLKKCVGKENLQRVNYLYQLGNNYAKSDFKLNNLLSIYYTNLMVCVSKKTVQRIEPNIKRRICKTCKNILIPGRNCKIHVRKQKTLYKCSVCNSSKSYISKEVNLWLDQPASINEILNYSQNKT
ncbi:hypothetical protein Trydic_g1974 [Trypoxylus dichotomus]